MSSDHSNSLRPRATAERCSSTISPSRRVTTTTSCWPSLSNIAHNTTWARRSSASRQRTRKPVDADRAGVEHPGPAPQSARVPSVGRPSHPWRTPVMFVRTADCGAQAISTASTCSSSNPGQLGDVEHVREEVALRVAEVRAVEPGIALIEDPVEHDPTSAAVVPGGGDVNRWRYISGPSLCGECRVVLPVAGNRDRGPVAVVAVEADAEASDVVGRLVLRPIVLPAPSCDRNDVRRRTSVSVGR